MSKDIRREIAEICAVLVEIRADAKTQLSLAEMLAPSMAIDTLDWVAKPPKEIRVIKSPIHIKEFHYDESA